MDVLIVDDHRIFREGFERVLDVIERIQKIKLAENGEEALLMIGQKVPDLVFMDVQMKVLDGIATTKLAIKSHPDLKIIGLSQYDDDTHVIKMYEAGASGYINKHSGIQEIKIAVDVVMDGDKYFDPQIVEKLATYAQKKQAIKKDKILSDRELQILELICKGKSDKEIASTLFVAVRTIEWHRTNILSKTGNKNIAMLINYSIENGLYFP
jgi:DNA-binding NarL/FixJ family response regulator